MYNESAKQAFIDKCSIDKTYTEKGLARIFGITEPLEEKYEKDVSEFDKKEIEELCKAFRCATLTSLNTRISILRRYSGEKSEIYNLKKSELNKFLVEKKNLYSSKEVDKYIKTFDNVQDKMLIQATYEGFSYEEILGLKYSDIYFPIRRIRGTQKCFSEKLGKLFQESYDTGCITG